MEIPFFLLGLPVSLVRVLVILPFALLGVPLVLLRVVLLRLPLVLLGAILLRIALLVRVLLGRIVLIARVIVPFVLGIASGIMTLSLALFVLFLLGLVALVLLRIGVAIVRWVLDPDAEIGQFLAFGLFRLLAVGPLLHREDVFEGIGFEIVLILGNQRDGFRQDVEGMDGVIPVGSMDRGSMRGEFFLRFGVGVVFVEQTADEFSAWAGELGDVDREHLVFGPLDGNAFEGGEEGGTAKGESADAEAPDGFGPVAVGELAEFNAAGEHRGDEVEEFPEIHPALGRGVSDGEVVAV